MVGGAGRCKVEQVGGSGRWVAVGGSGRWVAVGGSGR